MKMETTKTAPKAGEMVKLWSLPKGTKVIREGLRLDGNKTVGTFTITKQAGSSTFGRTSWDYEFHLDASLEVTVC